MTFLLLRNRLLLSIPRLNAGVVYHTRPRKASEPEGKRAWLLKPVLSAIRPQRLYVSRPSTGLPPFPGPLAGVPSPQSHQPTRWRPRGEAPRGGDPAPPAGPPSALGRPP